MKFLSHLAMIRIHLSTSYRTISKAIFLYWICLDILHYSFRFSSFGTPPPLNTENKSFASRQNTYEMAQLKGPSCQAQWPKFNPWNPLKVDEENHLHEVVHAQPHTVIIITKKKYNFHYLSSCLMTSKGQGLASFMSKLDSLGKINVATCFLSFVVFILDFI